MTKNSIEVLAEKTAVIEPSEQVINNDLKQKIEEETEQIIDIFDVLNRNYKIVRFCNTGIQVLQQTKNSIIFTLSGNIGIDNKEYHGSVIYEHSEKSGLSLEEVATLLRNKLVLQIAQLIVHLLENPAQENETNDEHDMEGDIELDEEENYLELENVWKKKNSAKKIDAWNAEDILYNELKKQVSFYIKTKWKKRVNYKIVVDFLNNAKKRLWITWKEYNSASYFAYKKIMEEFQIPFKSVQ